MGSKWVYFALIDERTHKVIKVFDDKKWECTRSDYSFETVREEWENCLGKKKYSKKHCRLIIMETVYG